MWNDWFGRWGRTIWAVVCGLIATLSTGVAVAQPVFENAYGNMQVNSVGYVWIDDYLIDSPDGLDYDTLTITSSPQNGSVTVFPGWGLMIYTPDEDYEGFDGFTFTVMDEQGVESAPSYVLIYVEPEGLITNLQPVIVGFFVEEMGGGVFTFNGYVLDDQDPYGRVVEFGGDLEGQTTTVGDNGMFSLVGTIPPEALGIVTVRYRDPYTVTSQESWQWIENF